MLLDQEAQEMVPAAVPTARFDGFPVVHEGRRLVVWELPGAVSTESRPVAEVAIWSAWLAAGAAVLGCGGLVVMRLARGRRFRARSQRL